MSPWEQECCSILSLLNPQHPEQRLVTAGCQSVFDDLTREDTRDFPGGKSKKREVCSLQWLRLCAPNAGAPSSIPGQRARSHMPQLKIPNATVKTEEPTCCNKEKKRHEFPPHTSKCQAVKQVQPSPTGAISLAGETPRKQSSVNTSTDLSGREVGGREGVQLISAEQWNVSGNLCAQEDRTLPRGLHLLLLRLFPDKSQNNLSGETADCGQNPHSWESFHSSSYRTMDALSALPSSHSPSQSDHYQFQ